jgi:HSP20 family protein
MAAMLMRTDPFREIDRLAEQFFGTPGRPAVMHIDAVRAGDWFYVFFDLPGVDPDSIDVTVERNVLTVTAQRQRPQLEEGAQQVIAERPMGSFSRQLFLGDTLDVEHLEAQYDAGVLTLRIPVAEQAKPRKIAVGSGGSGRKVIEA